MKKADSHAVRVARWIHLRHKPRATILFGSRARGDQREEQSDIDIMVVTEDSDSCDDYSISHEAEAYAEKVYGRPVEVHILCVPHHTVLEDLIYVNSLSATALAEGVVCGGRTRDLRPPKGHPRLHSWAMYDLHRRIAVISRKYLTAISGGENKLTDLDRVAASTVLALPETKRRQHAANHARSGLREALKTIIAACGLMTTQGEETATKTLADTVREHTRDGTLRTEIGIKDYENLCVPAHMTLEQYALLAIQDIQSLLMSATYHRRHLVRTFKKRSPAAAERE